MSFRPCQGPTRCSQEQQMKDVVKNLSRVVFALLMLVLTSATAEAAASTTPNCNINKPTINEAITGTEEAPVYTITNSYTLLPDSGYGVVADSEIYTYTCKMPDNITDCSSEFSSTSNIATLTPSQSGIYTVTVTLSAICRHNTPTISTSTEKAEMATYSPNVSISTTTTGDDDDDDDDDTTTTTCTPSVSYYVDSDGDSYGSSSATAVLFCADATTTETAGYVTDNTDCDDSVSTVHPGVSEDSRDTYDNDCDGVIADYYVTTVDPGTLTLTGDDDADDDDDESTGGGGCALQNTINQHKSLWCSFGFFIFSLLFFWRRQTLFATNTARIFNDIAVSSL